MLKCVCVNCGDVPDPDHVGLGLADEGHPGGMGGCGDLHDFRREEEEVGDA